MSKKPTYEELEQRLQESEQARIEFNKVEKKLREREKKYREVVNGLPVMICSFLPGGEITFVNKTFCNHFDKSFEELNGTSFFSLIPEAERETVLADLSALTVESSTQSHEHRVITASNDTGWQRWTHHAVFDARGKIVGYQSMGEEITEQKLAVETLKKSEKKFARAFHRGPLLMTISSIADGKYLEVNDNFVRVTGYSKEASIGTTSVDLGFISKEDRDRLKQELMQNGRVDGMELMLHKKNGDTLYCLYNGEIITIAGKKRLFSIASDITHIKKTEQALRESEEKFRGISEQSLVGVYLIQDSVFKYVNPKFAEIFGHTVEECLDDLPFNDLVHPDDRTAVTEQIRKRVSGEVESAHYTFRGKRKSGEIIDVEIFGSATIFNGKPAITGTLLDITENKQAQEELKKFRTISDKTVHGNAIADLKGNLIYVNDAFAGMHGYTADELKGKNLSIFHSEKQMEQIYQIHKTIVDEGRYGPLEVGHIHKNGTEIPMLMSGVVLRDKNGKPECIAASAIDISEQKRVEDKLAFERAQLLSIFDSIDEVVYVSDPDTYEILYVNQTLQEAYQKKLIGGICYKEFQGFDKPCDFCTNEIILNQKPLPYKWEYHNPKLGRDFSIIDRIIRWPNGCDARFEFAIDITERKRYEEQLQHAQKIEAIGTLAGGIAHDFNNILFPLMGFAEMLKDDLPTDSPLHYHIDEILQAALRAGDLVKQILAFSRQGDLDIKPIQLQPIVKEAFKLLRSSIPATIEILQEIDPGCGVVVSNPTQIHQIVMNLATNAYHAMEENGGRLKVQLKQVRLESEQLLHTELAPGEFACLSITDTGVGIEEAILDKVFDPYFTTKNTGKGTGLGLSVVQGIVKSCNGDIRISSKPGNGTKIQIYLPIADQKPCYIPSGRIKPLKGGDEKILLVDDEAPILRMEQKMLEKLGYDVTIRADSPGALELFKADSSAFDLVITDMTMPRMTGVQLAAEMKKFRPDIPIVLCTGFSHQVDDEKIQALGIKGFARKPVERKELAETIRKVLDGEKLSIRSRG